MHILQKIYQNKKHSIHGLILLQILIRLGVANLFQVQCFDVFEGQWPLFFVIKNNMNNVSKCCYFSYFKCFVY